MPSPTTTTTKTIETDVVIERSEKNDTNRDNSHNKKSNVTDIDVEKFQDIGEKLTTCDKSDECGKITRNDDIESNNVMNNDEEYEKWFYINNTGLALVLPFVVSIY